MKYFYKLTQDIKKTKPLSRSYVAVRSKANFSNGYLSASYRREILMVTCMIMKWGHDRDYIKKNPFSKYKFLGALLQAQ